MDIYYGEGVHISKDRVRFNQNTEEITRPKMLTNAIGD